MNHSITQGLFYKMFKILLSKLLVITSIVLVFKEINSQVLIFDLSERNIKISKDDLNADFTIFGYTNSTSSLVLKIKGPSQKVILQKKNKIFGMWSWSKTGEFIYPGLFHYYTNKDDDEIDFEVKKDLFDNVKLIGKDDDNLKKDLIEKKMSLDLFRIKNNSFQTINKKIPNFFKIPVKLPKNSPEGIYTVSLNIMDSINNFESKKIEIKVSKPGLSSFIFKFAHKFSFIYGLFSAMIAIGLGLSAGFVFRKYL
ncbi:MAG: hypothetical protein CBC25_03840 [Pelagibacteraceae bacterium TMED65]|nr:hypothetical protein [Rickettsiales bacterium]OUU52004.1 MAG: hypothetical protein CBC25_03840 [Pelagibacteraceae bacterium TMED65]